MKLIPYLGKDRMEQLEALPKGSYILSTIGHLYRKCDTFVDADGVHRDWAELGGMTAHHSGGWLVLGYAENVCTIGVI